MPDRINVALVISDLHAGGAERLLVDMVSAWQQQGTPIKPHVYTLRDGPIRDELELQGCAVSSSPVLHRLSPLVIPWLVRSFSRDHIHLAHLHLPRAGFYGRLAASIAWLPVLYTEHMMWEFYHPLSRFLNQSTYFLNSHAVAVSDAVLTSIRRHSRYSPTKLTRVYNGISLNGTIPTNRLSVRKNLNLPNDVPIVGTIANLKSNKGLRFLLHAVSLLLKEFPDLHWVIIGHDHGEGAILSRIAHQLCIEHHVHMIGYRKNARQLLSAFDIYALPSVCEGLPVALIEAMDAGLPIVATRVGGTPELILHGQTGLLVEPENVEELATSIRSLLIDPGKRAQMGEAARIRMKTEFTVESMAKRYAELYQALVPASQIERQPHGL
jgi:glycosyltransferase involved in cell wall biosynthesis